jgi:hypothetical protein
VVAVVRDILIGAAIACAAGGAAQANQRYSATAFQGSIVVIDTQTGEVFSCNAEREGPSCIPSVVPIDLTWNVPGRFELILDPKGGADFVWILDDLRGRMFFCAGSPPPLKCNPVQVE